MVDPHKLIVDLVEAAQVIDETPPFADDDAPANVSRETPAAQEKPADVPRAAPGGGDDDEPPDGNADDIVFEMNREFSLVLLGSRAVVMREMPDAPIEDRSRVLSLEAFKAYMQNKSQRIVRRVHDEKLGREVDKVSYRKLAPLWLTSRHRRTYDGIEFHPDPNDEPGTKGYFNLWRGFDVTPARDMPRRDRVKRYATFDDHLMNNIAGGDKGIYAWLFGWFAHIVQRPRERIGTAIVLRGGEGWGKTKIGEIVGSLFASHYFLVDDPRYLVGQFNAHMASCLLLQVDEGFWAGDKAAEGRLKGLITAKQQMIEAKGVDPIRLENYVRLMFSSNEDWVVPVGLDGRRYLVLDVKPTQARNADYFGEMDREMSAGGREALLADLLDFDLSKINLRDVPKTTPLLEQKLRSLDSVTSWWFERLSDGNLTRRRSGWAGAKGAGGFVAIDTLFDDYVHVAEKVGVRRKSEKTAFGMRMRKLLEIDHVSLLRTTKRTTEVEGADGHLMQRRVPCYDMPSLDICREAFEQACGQCVLWMTDSEADDAAEEARTNESEGFPDE